MHVLPEALDFFRLFLPSPSIFHDIRIAPDPVSKMPEEKMTVERVSLAQAYQVVGIKFLGRILVERDYVVRNHVFKIPADGATRVFHEVLGSEFFPLFGSRHGENLHLLQGKPRYEFSDTKQFKKRL